MKKAIKISRTPPKKKFCEARFEEYDVPNDFYDVVFSAQAFHSIPQPIGFQKSAEALKRGGYLALMWNMYITYANDLDKELLALSEKHGGFADFLSEKECEERISSIKSQIDNSGLFMQSCDYRQYWNFSYTAEDYFGFVLTGNRFVQKSQREKEEAYRDIVDLCNKHNGTINRPYLCVLYLAQKK